MRKYTPQAQRLAIVGFVFLFLGIALDRLAIRIPAATLPLALGSLTSLLGAAVVFIATMAKIQLSNSKTKAVIIGITIFAAGFLLMPLLTILRVW